jgi:hypothetical protein
MARELHYDLATSPRDVWLIVLIWEQRNAEAENHYYAE